MTLLVIYAIIAAGCLLSTTSLYNKLVSHGWEGKRSSKEKFEWAENTSFAKFLDSNK